MVKAAHLSHCAQLVLFKDIFGLIKRCDQANFSVQPIKRLTFVEPSFQQVPCATAGAHPCRTHDKWRPRVIYQAGIVRLQCWKMFNGELKDGALVYYLDNIVQEQARMGSIECDNSRDLLDTHMAAVHMDTEREFIVYVN